MGEFRNVVREHRFPASVRHRGPGRRRQRDRHQRFRTDTKSRASSRPLTAVTCATSMRRRRAANMWPCSLSITTTTRKPLIDFMTRPFAIHPTRVPAAKLTRRSAAGGTGTSFFFQYYLRLHRLRRLQWANHPMVKLRTRMSYLCTGVDVLVVCCGRACRGTQLQHRASPHQWT